SWAAPWRARHRSTNPDRVRRLLALALSVRLHQYKPNFLLLHYRPGEALGDRADTVDCQPGGDPLQIVHGGQGMPEWPRDGSAPGALPYAAVQTVAVGAHRAAFLLNGRA